MGRVFKAIIVLLTLLVYGSVLVYHRSVTFNAFNFNSPERRPGSVQVSELSLSIESVTKPSDNDSGQNKKTKLDDIFISVKTTQHHQDTRLPIILKTWFQLAKDQIWFFTDTDNKTQQQLTNGHMVNTNCSASHAIKHLCCKTSVEFDTFIESGKKWFCHFDDDNYVNVPRLVDVLQEYDYRLDWYLGRNSVPKPIKYSKKISRREQNRKKYNKQISDEYIKSLKGFRKKLHLSDVSFEDNLFFGSLDDILSIGAIVESFWFATFGAGVCISRGLALKMIPVVGGGKFMSICEKIRFPDDVTMGFVIETLMKKKLTVVLDFHSHLEQMKLISSDKFQEQISFSYFPNNTVEVPGFNESYDPTRFLSLHCFLFPYFEFCPR